MGNITTTAPSDFFKHEFMPRGWQWVDPVKEAEAALLELSMGINTRQNIAAGLGRDWKTLQEGLAAEAALLRAKDLPIVMSTKTRDPKPQEAAAAQSDPPQAPADNTGDPNNE